MADHRARALEEDERLVLRGEGELLGVVGDEVACEIEGIGRLVNTIAGDAEFGR